MIVNEAGNPPNVIFTMGCEIDNQKFTGVGRNKKDAKKHCAMEALKVNRINISFLCDFTTFFSIFRHCTMCNILELWTPELP